MQGIRTRRIMKYEMARGVPSEPEGNDSVAEGELSRSLFDDVEATTAKNCKYEK